MRLIAGEQQMADVRQQVTISLRTEFENFTVFNPGEYSAHDLTVPLDQVVAGALRSRHCAPWRQQPKPVRIPRRLKEIQMPATTASAAGIHTLDTARSTIGFSHKTMWGMHRIRGDSNGCSQA